MQARGLVVDAGAEVAVERSSFTDTHNSAVWTRGGAARLTDCRLAGCGGYGALYCTQAGRLG